MEEQEKQRFNAIFEHTEAHIAAVRNILDFKT